jgi:flagellin-like protein
MRGTGCSESTRSVSPVIGVALLLVIVVSLAAITAAFVLGLAGDQADPPKTGFEFEYDADTNAVSIEIQAGDAISDGNTEKLVVLVDGENGESRKTWAKEGGSIVDITTDDLTPSDEFVIDDSTGADTGDRTLNFELEKDDTLTIIWHAPDRDETAILREDTMPSLADSSSQGSSSSQDGVLDESGSVITDPGGAVGGDGGTTADILTGGTQAVGSTGDVDGDGLVEVPYVDSGGDLKTNDSNGEVQTLVDRSAVASKEQPDTDKTLMATGSWDGSPTSVFYANADHDRIYRVEPGGSPTLVEDLSSNGVNSVLGMGDIDGDGTDELVYADGSQEIRYLESSGTVETTGFTSGSSTGIGNGQLWDWDSDGKEEVVVVDGSNDVRLLDDTGAEATPAQSSVGAAKSPLTIADVDDDGENEIVYIDDSTAELRYIDDVTGTPTVETLTDAAGNIVSGDKGTGVVS